MNASADAMLASVERFLATSAAYLALGEFHGTRLVTAGMPEAQRLIDRYCAFAGSLFNAVSLVTGLRTGRPVSLWQNGQGLGFLPPTGPMGWGNVQRAIDLARAALAGQGITQPTPTELAQALVGRPDAPGVLQLRGGGVGWEGIAHRVAMQRIGTEAQPDWAPRRSRGAPAHVPAIAQRVRC